MRTQNASEEPTIYTIEVMDIAGNEKADNKKEIPAEDTTPHIAIEKVEKLDRKGVAPEAEKEHRADVGLGMKVSESATVSVGRGIVVERKDHSRLDSHDDGWRFRFKTKF